VCQGAGHIALKLQMLTLCILVRTAESYLTDCSLAGKLKISTLWITQSTKENLYLFLQALLLTKIRANEIEGASAEEFITRQL